MNEEWLNDKYVKRWLNGLKPRTKQNYIDDFPEFLNFIGMTPKEIINKRMHDLTTEDISERQFFEDKWREFKECLETKDNVRGSSITTKLTPIASFFSRNGLRLNLHHGDWKANVTQEPLKKWKMALEDVKAMYTHANLRDKALLLVLAQSGFSEVDIAELKVEHLKGLYEMPQTEHYFIEKGREKTTYIQATCLSYEALHDIREMLSERGKPQEGFLFTSQTKEKGINGIDTRRINEAMKALAVRTFGAEKAKEFNTKALRSFYNSALLRAKVSPQEIKDVMMGHKRQGARGHYAYDEYTIKEWYTKAFENLSINGIQSREDLAKMREDMNKLIGKQQVQIEEQKTELKSLKDLMNTQSDQLRKYSVELENVSQLLKRISILESHKKPRKKKQ